MQEIVKLAMENRLSVDDLKKIFGDYLKIRKVSDILFFSFFILMMIV